MVQFFRVAQDGNHDKLKFVGHLKNDQLKNVK
jgi:hypothetical protein